MTDITSRTGAPLAWTEYTPFGTIRASGATSQAPANPSRFTGEYRDSTTGLYHLRARQYDPGTGRFLSTDPLSPAIGDPYVGAYVYVRNNPVRWVDPSGRESQAAGGRYNVVECLSGLLGFYGFGVAGLAQVAGGVLLQGFSITIAGVTFGGATPVTVGGIVAGLGLDLSGLATEAAGVALVYKTCVNQ